MSARLERVHEYLESRRVSGKFEQSHDANNTEELEYVMVLLKIIEHEVKIETERRDEVDDVDRSEDERALAGTDDKPNTLVQTSCIVSPTSWSRASKVNKM